ncbi:alpha-L-fucosidase [Chitinophaga jiangningensis]|uniref:alpha-L-fucosidase n=1 Tax=Chitinophaga jiangningensis TaxID=1419482 RepID=A0A1M6VCV5_9BACT|nr:alpha-L-fucosidase [Chitinophaga jiangningensis]SHK79343.1 alpha-L-fucosidase [Chitinophaga jiangningensis]
MKITPILAGLLACNMAMAQEIKPYGALPSKSQLEWNDMEYYMFIHFGPNTFTNKEWGHGDEDPKVFNPTHVDARQWARTAKLAGMKGIVLTAKHHDGFCLWPSKYSTHTVRESMYKGDILKELSAACKEYGLKFGVYLSPWDRNHPDYGTPQYNQTFVNTLTEVLSNYGPVFEQWFDGANDGTKPQQYDFELFNNTVHKLQPNAVIFSDVGPGCRWVGNENGIAGTTNWSTLNIKGYGPGKAAPPQQQLNEGVEDGEAWVPAECDVSIRPGWFYSPDTDDKVKSLQDLLKIYYGSVGRNGNLILNVPVSRDGVIHKNDSTRLMELRRVLDATFKNNLARKGVATASVTRSGNSAVKVSHLNDGNPDTYWATPDNVTSASFTLTFKQPVTFNRIGLEEYLKLGQRVKAFSVEILENGQFREVAKASTIGHKRILELPKLTTTQVRVNILDAKACPVIREVGLYLAPVLVTQPVLQRNNKGDVIVANATVDQHIYYTTDGSTPGTKSNLYKMGEVIALPSGGVVKAVSIHTENGKTERSAVTSVGYDVAPAKWTVQPAAAARAIDGQAGTAWVSEAGYPQELVVDLSEALTLKGFTYTPVTNAHTGGVIYGYEFYTSGDGKAWTKAAAGMFANIKNNPVQQSITFSPVKARYIKLVATRPAAEGDKKVSVAELGIITR